ncbi:MAG TPA: sulfotransferase [Candidatus Deferrimicrobium sp.]|nr:sulfotransferase [Candidatus Deferrimicrobium sp.]
MEEKKRRGRPILITGAHRSGSTWVGQMVAKSPEVCYIFEPFNKDFGPGVCRAVFDTWFPYVTRENEGPYRRCIAEILDYKFHSFKELLLIRTKSQARLWLENFYRLHMARIKKQRILFKDPIAFFSAPWLAEVFDFQVVVLIRHPAAFAGSLKRLKWHFPFHDLLKQPLLIEGPLHPFKEEIAGAAQGSPDIIEQAALLWKIIYTRTLAYRQEYPGWIFMRHEDISFDPTGKFKSLYESLGLTFTPGIDRDIREYSAGSNPKERPDGQATFLKRDSKENIAGWKKHMLPGDVERVRQITGEAAAYFYAESEW